MITVLILLYGIGLFAAGFGCCLMWGLAAEGPRHDCNDEDAYSPEWDAELNRLLDTESFTKVAQCRAFIGGHEVWHENHPYASFRHITTGAMPSKATAIRAHEKLVADTIDAYRKREVVA